MSGNCRENCVPTSEDDGDAYFELRRLHQGWNTTTVRTCSTPCLPKRWTLHSRLLDHFASLLMLGRIGMLTFPCGLKIAASKSRSPANTALRLIRRGIFQVFRLPANAKIYNTKTLFLNVMASCGSSHPPWFCADDLCHHRSGVGPGFGQSARRT